MLKTRIITAALLVFIMVGILSYVPHPFFMPVFTIMVFLWTFGAGSEYAALRAQALSQFKFKNEIPRPKSKLRFFIVGFSYSIPTLIYSYFTHFSSIYSKDKIDIIIFSWVFVSILISAIAVHKIEDNLSIATDRLLNFVAGYIYILLPSIFIYKLLDFNHPIRSILIYYVLFVVHMGDAGAYFVGMKIGKRKLIPSISPKKSVEGALGGLVFSAVTAVIFKYVTHFPFSVMFCIISGLILGVSGQIGDLIESAFKRASGYKDSGFLLPGHGGILDRVDSLMLGIPVAYLLFNIIN